MNGIATILTLTPFAAAIFLCATDKNNVLDYGALGLCAIIVLFLCAHIKSLTEKLDRKDKVLGELYERNTAAYQRLANLLEDRPCLMRDKRIQQPLE